MPCVASSGSLVKDTAHCTVQPRSASSAAAAPVPHFYTLEASVDGDALRDGGVADPDALRWCVVDVNGMSDHDDIGFWQAAAEVPLV